MDLRAYDELEQRVFTEMTRMDTMREAVATVLPYVKADARGNLIKFTLQLAGLVPHEEDDHAMKKVEEQMRQDLASQYHITPRKGVSILEVRRTASND